MKLISLLTFTFCLVLASGQLRLFYETTTSLSSIINSQAYCFLTSTQTSAYRPCGTKKKRAAQMISEISIADDILPSSVFPEDDTAEPELEVMSSLGKDRKGRQLAFWVTTTSTSATATSTIGTLTCRPVGDSYEACTDF